MSPPCWPPRQEEKLGGIVGTMAGMVEGFGGGRLLICREHRQFIMKSPPHTLVLAACFSPRPAFFKIHSSSFRRAGKKSVRHFHA